MLLPVIGFGQDGGWADYINGLQGVLDDLLKELLPKCQGLVNVARGIAGFGAIWYIGVRVWRQLANAESIDLYPLFRPFVLGFAILIFPQVLALINGIMQPVSNTTGSLVKASNATVALLLKQKEEAIKSTATYQMYLGNDGAGDYAEWYKYTHPKDPNGDNEGWLDGMWNPIRFEMAKIGYSFKNQVKEVIAEVLQLIYAAASLCINTMRTFNLVILGMLGPLVFGLACFDGFQHTLKHWLARYVNVFLWLPVCNIFAFVLGTIQEKMLKIDLTQIAQQGDTHFSRTDAGYMIFMIIGIIGYTTVPSVANYIMFVGGGDALTSKVSGVGGAAAGMAASAGMAAGGFAAKVGGQGMEQMRRGAGNFAYFGEDIGTGMMSENTNPNSMASKAGGLYGRLSSYLGNKLKGK
jgi:conjugative transposon TraJ protein